MPNINLTIQRGKRGLFFTEGQPIDLGIEAAHEYAFFLYSRIQVRVWITDDIAPNEYKLVSHEILAFLKNHVDGGAQQAHQKRSG